MLGLPQNIHMKNEPFVIRVKELQASDFSPMFEDMLDIITITSMSDRDKYSAIVDDTIIIYVDRIKEMSVNFGFNDVGIDLHSLYKTLESNNVDILEIYNDTKRLGE